MRQYCIILLHNIFIFLIHHYFMKLGVLEIKARIIRKLIKWRKWGGAHTENILKGLPGIGSIHPGSFIKLPRYGLKTS